MANDISGKNQGIYKCIRDTYNLEGMRGIYRGVGVTYISMIIYRGLFFGTYDTVKMHTNNIYERFLVGYTSAVIAITLNYPLDTVRRRLMMTSGHSFKYKGFLDCLKTIYKT
jgi:solute carrier family 25 (mitochondrial adenine nucleotide translocator), member 4/5/6/31